MYRKCDDDDEANYKILKYDQTKLNNNDNQNILESTNTFVMDVDKLAENDMVNLAILPKLSTQVFEKF
jgi:hypothetical protein